MGTVSPVMPNLVYLPFYVSDSFPWLCLFMTPHKDLTIKEACRLLNYSGLLQMDYILNRLNAKCRVDM